VELAHARARDAAVKRYGRQPGVVSVGIGFKWVGGQKTDTVAVVVGVVKKKPVSELAIDEVVAAEVEGLPTDVQEYGPLKALALTQRVRPAPGGYSCGHFSITAGTLGAWVKRGASSQWFVLSNNHVLANSNEATLADRILQPGPYDGGESSDQIASLTEFVRIRFDGEDGGGGNGQKKPKAAVLWRLAKFIPNTIARLVRCPYRLVIARPLEISQPYPNLVDAAVAVANNEADVDPTIEFSGPVAGIRDLQLGDAVKKTGRTTGFTQGIVDVLGATVTVDYGGKVATFENQVLVSGAGFSAGGDSGSAILTEDGYLGGLLFAGGEGITVCNRIADVVALLGVRV